MKRVVITGGSRGIGAAAVELFAALMHIDDIFFGVGIKFTFVRWIFQLHGYTSIFKADKAEIGGGEIAATFF